MVQGEGKHEQEDGEEQARGPAWIEETAGQGGDGLGPNLASGEGAHAAGHRTYPRGWVGGPAQLSRRRPRVHQGFWGNTRRKKKYKIKESSPAKTQGVCPHQPPGTRKTKEKPPSTCVLHGTTRDIPYHAPTLACDSSKQLWFGSDFRHVNKNRAAGAVLHCWGAFHGRFGGKDLKAALQLAFPRFFFSCSFTRKSSNNNSESNNIQKQMGKILQVLFICFQQADMQMNLLDSRVSTKHGKETHRPCPESTRPSLHGQGRRAQLLLGFGFSSCWPKPTHLSHSFPLALLMICAPIRVPTEHLCPTPTGAMQILFLPLL